MTDISSKKRQKFVELAEKRMANAIKGIRLIGNLGNRAAYEFTDADAAKIINALSAEVEEIRVKLASPSRKAEITFKL